MRPRRTISRITVLIGAASVIVWAWASSALAQQGPEVTPNFQNTPAPPDCALTSPSAACGQWTYWAALGAIVIGAVIVLGIVALYVRSAPKFFGREEAPKTPPGVRPRLLQTTSGRAPGAAPRPGAVGTAAATSPAAQTRTGTATAVAERPAQARAPTGSPVEGSGAEGQAAVAASSAGVTAPPEGEPAVQADAGGQAEVAAPEAKPAAPPATGGTLDQATFDRVLQEQLDKGVDRRVAEGRARAAAVVAARKKGQS